jgi:hypothetical protein
MRKFFGPMGTVSRMASESQALKSNMLGDPSMRVVDVYVPAGHVGQGLPLLVDLVGFSSSGLSQTNWVGFRENLPERLDRLIGERRMPPVSSLSPIASPGSAATSTSTQRPPALGKISCCMRCCRQSRTASAVAGAGVAASSARARAGTALSRTRCATPTSGRPRPAIPADMGFELCYLPDMPAVLRALAGAENSIEKWWQQLEAAKKHPEGSGKVINALAMAASYDPDPTSFSAFDCR